MYPAECEKRSDWVPVSSTSERECFRNGTTVNITPSHLVSSQHLLVSQRDILELSECLWLYSWARSQTLDTISGMQTYFFSNRDASTLQRVDVFSAFVHKSTNQPIVAEDDAGHLSDVLMTLAFSDVATVIDQARHQIAFPSFLIRTLFQLRNR